MFSEIVAEVQADPDSLGLILHGSRAAGSPRDDSDYDLIRVVTDSEYARRKEAGTLLEKRGSADVLFQNPARLRWHAENPSEWTATYVSAEVVVDKTGEVAKLVGSIVSRASEQARANVPESYDAYLNSFVRSLKAWRRGDVLGGRLHAAESASHLIRTLFGLESRWPPYHDRLHAQLPEIERAQGWEEGALRSALLRLVDSGDPTFQQELEQRVEGLHRSRGHEHEWGEDLEPLKALHFEFAPDMRHLALSVRDEERSRRFYETYLGFDAGPSDRKDDGVLFIRNAHMFNLALGPHPPSWTHFGFRLAGPAHVRAMRERLEADGVTIVEWWDEPDYVSVKCLDPDGYVIEMSWES